MDILGTRIDNLSKAEILEKVNAFLNEPGFHQIATVNPEFVLEAQRNSEFKNILNNCDLNVADGVGLKFACWKYGRSLQCRMPGIDLMQEILKIANERKLKIFLAVNKDGLSSYEETKQAILTDYPNILIEGADIDVTDQSYIIPSTSYMILLCNFGAPHQEVFINRHKCDKIRLAMGVGGSFDFLTRKVNRAPRFLSRMGLEWLWRIIQLMRFNKNLNRWKRIKRILSSIFIFAYRERRAQKDKEPVLISAILSFCSLLCFLAIQLFYRKGN